MTSREQLAAENGMSVEYVNWFFDHKKDGCGNVWFVMMAAMWEGWQAASKASEQQLAAVVAENSGLKDSVEHAAGCIHAAEVEGLIDALGEKDGERLADLIHRRLCHAYFPVETPETDAYLAEVRAQGVDMYAATLDRGAVDAERDGFDDGMKFLRAEAEGVRKFAAQLRQGAAHE